MMSVSLAPFQGEILYPCGEASCQASGIKQDYIPAKSIKHSLAILNQLGLKFTLAISGNLNLDLSEIPFDPLFPCPFR